MPSKGTHSAPPEIIPCVALGVAAYSNPFLLGVFRGSESGTREQRSGLCERGSDTGITLAKAAYLLLSLDSTNRHVYSLLTVILT